MKLAIETIVSMPFAQNTFVVRREDSREAVVIDPGMEPGAILDFLRRERLAVSAILNTHGHGDHIAGNAEMKRAFPQAPLIIGLRDLPLLTDPVQNVSALFGAAIVSPAADGTLEDGQRCEYAGIPMRVQEIPGHSPGHVVFIVEATEPATVFGGDVLFRGSIGRTDFPGGSLQTLLAGIRRHLLVLPPESIVYPGHGEPTTVGEEAATNVFLNS